MGRRIFEIPFFRTERGAGDGFVASSHRVPSYEVKHPGNIGAPSDPYIPAALRTSKGEPIPVGALVDESSEPALVTPPDVNPEVAGSVAVQYTVPFMEKVRVEPNGPKAGRSQRSRFPVKPRLPVMVPLLATSQAS